MHSTNENSNQDPAAAWPAKLICQIVAASSLASQKPCFQKFNLAGGRPAEGRERAKSAWPPSQTRPPARRKAFGLFDEFCPAPLITYSEKSPHQPERLQIGPR
ncbi:hypothetical protein [Bradyrhizobium sp. USDA 3364]